jgi:mannose-1-phosphate guanylyltransferase
MRNVSNTWAVILAAGDGKRLREITTTTQGETIPKQFCSLRSRACLLEDAIERAYAVAPPQQVCAVVAAQHRRWWALPLSVIAPRNIFVQPANRGTAHGILLALLRLEARDADATVVLLPADHYLSDESKMARTLRVAANLASDNRDRIYLLGAAPDGPDEELGYIVPAARPGEGPEAVVAFVEKPSSERARELVKNGALCNTFIVAGTVRALLALFDAGFFKTIAAMRAALKSTAASTPSPLDALYENMESIDFSNEVLALHPERLEVLRVPPCGWTDLGTPRRVAAVVRHLPRSPAYNDAACSSPALFLDLALTSRNIRPQACAQG